MAIELIEIKKNTRGINSREIKYLAIGKYITKTVQRDTRPGKDEHGNDIRLPLEKDKDGKNIYVDEVVEEFVTKGVLTDFADAMRLVANAPHETVPAFNEDGTPKLDEKGEQILEPISNEQILLDCFAEGFNERQYALEADKDELDEFLADLGMDDQQKAAFKRTARQIAKNYDMSLIESAEQVKGLMLKQRAKAEAKAKAAAETETVTA